MWSFCPESPPSDLPKSTYLHLWGTPQLSNGAWAVRGGVPTCCPSQKEPLEEPAQARDREQNGELRGSRDRDC